jgi:tetratricopeptide (TPR) repeat protein
VTTGRRSALLVATDRYEDEGFTELRAPAGDADALAKVLGDPDIGGFDVAETIHNQPERMVRRKVDAFLSAAQLDDTVLLYISGHGVLSEDGRLYFATTDTELPYLLSTAVEAAFVNRSMQLSRARRKVLVLDCCHSGAFARDMATKGDGHVHVASHFQGRGNVTLTASDELEYALEERDAKRLDGAQAGSLFTRFLVEGLESGKADVNGDGLISVDELHKYVFDRIRDRTSNQTPGITGDMRGEIIIATTRARAAAGLPSGLAEQLASPFAGVRAGVAHELAKLRRSADPRSAGAATRALEQMLEDDSLTVREAAQQALSDAPPESARSRARPRPQVVNLLRRADAKRARGELEAARADLDEALRLEPQSVEGLAARGNLRRRLGDLAGAREDFEAALTLDADDYDSLVGRGRIRALDDDTEASLADLSRAIELDAECPDAYVARGFALAFAVPRREAEAAADFEQVLAFEPEHPEALTGIGVLAMEERPEEAAAAFGRALQAEPEQPLALAFRGALGGGTGLLDLKRACGLAPHSPYVRTANGLALMDAGKLDLALAEFDAVLELLPGHAATLARRGAVRVQLDDPEAALADLDLALQIDDRNATALLWRGTAKLRRGEPEAALEDLGAVVEREDEAAGPPVAQLRAEALVALGRHAEALGDLDSAPASELDAGMLVTRGRARLELDRPGEAIADAQAALALDATHAEATELLARAFLAVAATIPPPATAAQQRARLAANRELVAGAELEGAWYDDQKQAVLELLNGTEQLLWLCRCRRQGEMFRSVAFLVTSEQVIWCKRGALGSPQTDRLAVGDLRKVQRIDGGFKLHAAGKVEAAFTGFTGGGIDLVGAGVNFFGNGVLALLRLMVDRARAAA